MKYFLFIVVLVGIIVSSGCVSENQKTLISPTITAEPGEPAVVPSTQQINQSGVVNNGIFIFRNPEKIIRPKISGW